MLSLNYRFEQTVKPTCRRAASAFCCLTLATASCEPITAVAPSWPM